MNDDKLSLHDVLAALDRLHRPKDLMYGDAWRKRGEVLSIFSNLARKFDRLTKYFDQNENSAVEAVIDTLADLCVYAGKYATWLAEVEPDAFKGVTNMNPQDCAARRGPDSLEAVFEWILATSEKRGVPEETSREAWKRTRDVFVGLEEALLEQAEGRPAREPTFKISAALELTLSSAHCLLAEARGDLREWRTFLEEIGRFYAA